ncbi:hypothetical protein JKP88DRAFT_351601 [Tribonema minus]|uniref:Uncharacterized protein n=1 Tax=Tribonema minus TaxID=303371 RepID=A0A836C772_9STRA|nr:hypothetical protein JKP88DRAFT_351601 [Tribonema minus]
MGVSLPAGDLFNRPDANLVIFLDGVTTSAAPWRDTMPFLQETFGAGAPPFYTISTDGAGGDAAASVLHGALASQPLARSGGAVFCGSRSAPLYATPACFTAGSLSRAARVPSGKSFDLLGLTGAYDAATRTWSVEGPGGVAAQLRADSPSDAALLQELALLAAARAQLLGARRSAAAAAPPALAVLHLTALGEAARGGSSGAGVAAAAAVLDAALRGALAPGAQPEGEQLVLTAQLVVGAQLAPAAAAAATAEMSAAARRLAAAAGANATANVTLVDITQYQLNLWTGVFFALLVVAAIYGVASMDIGRDSLLYAKFQADTSAKND